MSYILRADHLFCDRCGEDIARCRCRVECGEADTGGEPGESDALCSITAAGGCQCGSSSLDGCDMKTRTVAFTFDGQLRYARQSTDESPIDAVARSIGRRLGPVEVWYSGTDKEMNEDLFTARWFDTKTETYREATIKLPCGVA